MFVEKKVFDSTGVTLMDEDRRLVGLRVRVEVGRRVDVAVLVTRTVTVSEKGLAGLLCVLVGKCDADRVAWGDSVAEGVSASVLECVGDAEILNDASIVNVAESVEDSGAAEIDTVP